MSDERTENKRREHLRGSRKNMKFTLQRRREVGDLRVILLERKRMELLNMSSVTDECIQHS